MSPWRHPLKKLPVTFVTRPKNACHRDVSPPCHLYTSPGLTYKNRVVTAQNNLYDCAKYAHAGMSGGIHERINSDHVGPVGTTKASRRMAFG